MDLESFLGPGYKYVHGCLVDEKGFPPFALLLASDLTTKMLLPDDGKIETVRAAIANRDRSGIFAVGLFYMVDVQDEQGATQRAIHLHLDVPQGPNRIVLTLYRFEGDELLTGQPSYVEATERILPER
jgi:hypothetical protein